MITYRVNENILRKAITRTFEDGSEASTNKNNINGNVSKFRGYVGEEIMLEYWSGADHVNTPNYDLIYKNTKVEIKTRMTSVVPFPEMVVNIGAHRLQKTDVYLFLFLNYDYRECYIAGTIKKDTFLQHAELKNKGDKHVNGEYYNDTFILPIKYLKPLKEEIEAKQKLEVLL